MSEQWKQAAYEIPLGVSQERFEELCHLVREEPLFPGQADDGDPTLLSPDAARWTPEDDG